MHTNQYRHFSDYSKMNHDDAITFYDAPCGFLHRVASNAAEATPAMFSINTRLTFVLNHTIHTNS